MYGELVPIGGGDPIVLLKKRLRVGRRESCDIVLRFANVSAHHCLLSVEDGYWFVKDLNSRNGVKVNDTRLKGDGRKRIDPDDVISIAKHKYELKYSPAELGAVGPPPSDDREENFLGQSLLERAGLARRAGKERDPEQRYDVTDNRAGQLKHDPNRPT
ncbi:MAG: FHA domain-containing protein [Pirellulaceae bacterium]